MPTKYSKKVNEINLNKPSNDLNIGLLENNLYIANFTIDSVNDTYT